MYLNTIKSGPGVRTKPRRVGRGIGSGLGKTSGKGHKGQKARAGASAKVGFEGGQMPLQRRLPKVGFRSRKKADVAEVRVDQLDKLAAAAIDLKALRDAKIVRRSAKRIRIIDSGNLSSAVTVVKVTVTPGAAKKIEAAGGRIEA